MCARKRQYLACGTPGCLMVDLDRQARDELKSLRNVGCGNASAAFSLQQHIADLEMKQRRTIAPLLKIASSIASVASLASSAKHHASAIEASMTIGVEWLISGLRREGFSMTAHPNGYLFATALA